MAKGDKGSPLSNGDVPVEVSKKSVEEVLVDAKVLLPLIATGSADAKTKATYAAKVVAMPTVTTSMSRKVNTGDYENLDFFFSVQVPLGLTDDESQLHSELCAAAIQQGIDIVNPQISERYKKVKDKVEQIQKNKKKP